MNGTLTSHNQRRKKIMRQRARHTNGKQFGLMTVTAISKGLVDYLWTTFGPPEHFGPTLDHLWMTGPLWTNLDHWTALDHFGPLWTDLDRFGLIWTDLDRFGPIWTDLD
jgi:hypothetical protein